MQRVSENGHTARTRATVTRERVEPRLSYLPGLDGLRALAVIAVVCYHAGLSVRGGFLGVESFFVLSGFLITALLAAEWQRDGHISLVSFWRRRARRLLPALVLVLLGTLALTAIRLPDESARLRIDILAALGYAMNWRLIFSGQSYFDPFVRPPLLQHLWSLAIEEQFYLFWPVLFALGMRYLRRAGLLLTIAIVAVASALLMASLYEPGADPSRVYYGTDTRASALLIGAALALAWRPWNRRDSRRPAVGRALDVAGLIALAGLIMAYVRLFEYHPLLYRGGFLLVSLTTALLIAAIAHPESRLMPRLLGAQPLRWLGLRSYGIYLWHWPIFMVTRPYLDVPFDGWLLQALRVAVVLVVADTSYRLIETPIRRAGFRRAFAAARGLPLRAIGSAKGNRVIARYRRAGFPALPATPFAVAPVMAEVATPVTRLSQPRLRRVPRPPAFRRRSATFGATRRPHHRAVAAEPVSGYTTAVHYSTAS